jgi:hypothetical protein
MRFLASSLLINVSAVLSAVFQASEFLPIFIFSSLQTHLIQKKAVFWDVALCINGVNRRFGGTYRLHLQGRREIIRKSAREA